MSRSYRKPYFKVKGYMKSIYWRVIRRVNKNLMKSNKELKHPKEIINDYDYCDYIWYNIVEKLKRK